MKNINPLGLFDDHFLLEKLTKLGDPLQKLNEFINWKIFESPINEAFKNEDRDLSKGGRPPFNRLILFKTLDAAGVFANEGKMNEKGYRNNPLTEEQKANNKEKSKTRARVEHLFGFVENSMNGSFIRTIGIARAKAKIGMMNLTYNICRCVQLKIVVAMG